MIDFAHIHEKWIKLPHSIPVPQTMINPFSLLNSKQFAQCIIEQVKHLHPELAKQLIVVNGKTIRGSAKTNNKQEHCVSAWAAQTELTLAL